MVKVWCFLGFVIERNLKQRALSTVQGWRRLGSSGGQWGQGQGPLGARALHGQRHWPNQQLWWSAPGQLLLLPSVLVCVWYAQAKLRLSIKLRINQKMPTSMGHWLNRKLMCCCLIPGMCLLVVTFPDAWHEWKGAHMSGFSAARFAEQMQFLHTCIWGCSKGCFWINQSTNNGTLGSFSPRL